MRKSSTVLNLISMILLLVVIIGAVFYINPMKEQVTALSTELASKDTEVAELSARIAELETLRDEIGESGATEGKLLLQVPEGMDQSGIINDLNDLAIQAGIALNGMSFSAVDGDTSSVLGVSASFDGDYDDLINFLETVEDNTRKIRVKSISVQLSEKDTVPHASFSLLMECYYQ
ncbi:MAG: type 4a pilus biogenesis protein PilO [Candidatus Gracilibacteria bacterium]|jgi:Tfp pilus assembly protein PilO